ncbi:hypothetical protein [Orrella daihaiensis]|uniref:Uncharacterized protein n=1 Tax=Orrella daihaiensis TaxID=2782176 RepID=A0ABY4AHL7_9BURK|nr:hypothetical protein [Orrella daihaiensis]UOD49784.1 hypothetical protein DHf2319_10025 [Orrella daihaiensis]
MVTFYRKAQINGNTPIDKETVGSIDLSQPIKPERWSETEYLGILNPEDDLPYVVIRPKVNRKNNKKILRMRGHWD